jgi:general secretion pathway protein M
MNVLQTKWAALGAREQRLIVMATTLVAIALLWWLALAPALQTVRTAPAQHTQVDAQLQSMRSLAAEATTLRAQRALSYEESLRNLESSVKQTLGAGATLSVSDTRASLTLKGVSANALAQWLSQSRTNARVVPSEARLTRSLAGAAPVASVPAGTATTANTIAWDGTLVLALPAR